MPLKLVRRPRPSTVQHQEILDQVGPELESIAEDSIQELEDDISDWDTQPVFKSKVHVGKRVWRIKVYVDRRTRAGKIYNWVDKGTGERGGGEPYDIYPKKADALSFDVPYDPKTEPKLVPGLTPPNFGPVNPGPEAHLVLPIVNAKGIRPRNFTRELFARLSDRKNTDGLKMRIDSAIKRGIYRIGKQRVRPYTRR
jgi:hypothetical protein